MGMRLVKLFVIVGGIVLVVGSGILFTRLYEKLHGSSHHDSASSQDGVAIPFPADGKVVSATAMGSGVALLVSRPSGAAQLLIIKENGWLWRRVHLDPSDAPEIVTVPSSRSQEN